MKYEPYKINYFEVILVVIIGMALPFIFGDDGLLCFDWHHLSAVVPVVVLYGIARAMFGRLCYLPLVAGYGYLAVFYLNYTITEDIYSWLTLRVLRYYSAIFAFIGFIIAVVVDIIMFHCSESKNKFVNRKNEY